MTLKHFTASLWAFNHRRPFKSYMIELVSGGRILVSHPETVFLRGELWEYISPERGHHLFENESVVQLLDVPKPPPS
jgi:hypothetical protein